MVSMSHVISVRRLSVALVVVGALPLSSALAQGPRPDLPTVTSLTASAPCFRDAVLDRPAQGARTPLRFTYTLSAESNVRVTLRRRVESSPRDACPKPSGRVPGTYTDVDSRFAVGATGPNDLVLGSAARRRPTRDRTVTGRQAAGRAGVTLAQVAGERPLPPGTYRLEVATLDEIGRAANTAQVRIWVLNPS